MQVFFSSLFSLEQFAASLNSPGTANHCQHCDQNDQWVSHGYVYKYQPASVREVVGKRIICSRRYGRVGCGRSFQLYLQSVIPHRHYTLQVLLAFILAMINGRTVAKAWASAVSSNDNEPRQAWRWLNAIMKQLPLYRTYLLQHTGKVNRMRSYQSRRFNILLPTLAQLLQLPADNHLIQAFLQRRFC